MTQYSFFWACGTDGDQGNVTLQKMAWNNMLLGNSNPSEGGVLYWTDPQIPPVLDSDISFTGSVDGLLKPTNPSGSVVRIASGVGMVLGWIYLSDANVDFDISSDLGAASATDLIVLEKDNGTSTVRLARVKGGAGSTATVTQNSTIWQVEIARVELDGSGDFSALIDTRKLARPPVGGIIKIDERDGPFSEEFTISDIPPFFRDLRIYFSGRRSAATANDFVLLILAPGVSGGGGTITINHNGTSSTSSTDPERLYFPGSPSPAGATSSYILDVINYSSILDKQVIVNGSRSQNGAVSDPATISGSFILDSSEALSSIQVEAGLFAGGFVEGSRFALYGII